MQWTDKKINKAAHFAYRLPKKISDFIHIDTFYFDPK